MAKKWRCTVCGYIHEGPEAPEQCPMCKVGKEKFVEVVEKEGDLEFVTEHVIGDGKGAGKELWEGLQNHFMGECTEVGMYLAMSRQADREGYPEIAEAYKRYAWEEAEHASKFAELIGEVVWDTKTNLEKRMNAECGACEDKMRLARMAKEQNLFLNPAKISGICGRLLCCLSYEQENYDRFHHNCPRLGKKYQTTQGTMKVLRANMFRNSLSVLNENNEEQELTLEEWQALDPHRPEPHPNNAQPKQAQQPQKAAQGDGLLVVSVTPENVDDPNLFADVLPPDAPLTAGPEVQPQQAQPQAEAAPAENSKSRRRRRRKSQQRQDGAAE